MSKSEKVTKAESTNSFDSINIKSYISSIAIILVLMIFTYVLTFLLKPGHYDETTLVYSELNNVNFPFWKFILSPFLVLGFDGNTLLIAILAFLCVIGGVFEALTKCNFMEYLLKKLVSKFYKRRYLLIYILSLFFMLLGSFVGTFEEVIPMIPFICALTTSLGFDNLIGLGISLLAAGSGFAAGIMNPFTIGIAQQIADVPLFSGVWLRIVTFILIYFALTTFLLIHAKRLDKKNGSKLNEFKVDFVKNEKLDKAILAFGIILGTGLTLVISSTFIKALQDYTLIIIALAFLVGGIVAAKLSGMKTTDMLKAFLKGAYIMLPGILMILLASSIRYILVESCRLDTLIYHMISLTNGLSPYVLILFIYLISTASIIYIEAVHTSFQFKSSPT